MQGLPYGTMSDDEMRDMAIEKLQDDGVIFMWVTGEQETSADMHVGMCSGLSLKVKAPHTVTFICRHFLG